MGGRTADSAPAYLPQPAAGLSADLALQLLQVRRQDEETAFPELAAYTTAKARLPLSAVLRRNRAELNH